MSAWIEYSANVFFAGRIELSNIRQYLLCSFISVKPMDHFSLKVARFTFGLSGNKIYFIYQIIKIKFTHQVKSCDKYTLIFNDQ